MKPIILPILLLLLAFLSSCFKEDERVPRHDPGDLSSDTIAMTKTYKYQVYYDLGTASAVASNEKTAWDIGFECSPEGWRVILNSSNFMMVCDAGMVPFGTVLDTTGKQWDFDTSDGHPDSNAIGPWFTVAGEDTLSNGHVYILDRGMDEDGDPLGFRQIIFDSLANGTYFFRLSYLDGGSPLSYAVPKDPDRNYIYFTFRFGGTIQALEPPRNGWDLLFTQYSTTLFTNAGDPEPYLVTGVLLNRHLVMAARDSVHLFSEITPETAQAMTLTNRMDVIGWDWKYYDFDAGVYTVLPDMIYIIMDTEGFYYKLRFTAFNNQYGEKGFPVIEFQRL